jgi:hypothetical protein
MNFLRKKFPIFLALVMGLAMWLRYYVPNKPSEDLLEGFTKWGIIIAGFASILGILSLLHHHWFKIKRRQPGFAYSFITYVAFLTMLTIGIISGLNSPSNNPMEQGTAFAWMYGDVMVPLQSTMFSILGFFVASAAFRAFRARTPEATLLLVAAIIVMLGRVPIGEVIWSHSPKVSEWIMNVINTAGNRGIILGVGLSQIAIALRIIFGIERTYMGGGD